ncbi:hypothetical protein GCM10010191_45840 [Actinomadura vinacea]|uniref:Uncharacterized protein n=1 Tax=Actinomadura vinacea TaxID=115336 RepID=A0ABN3JGJ4_9ACTN
MAEPQSGVAHFATGDRTAMRMLSQQSETFGTEWAAAKVTIGLGEAGIGTDPIAAAFSGVYRSPAEFLKIATDEVPAICLAWAQVGNTSADQYVESDRAGEGAIRGGGN